MPSTYLKRHIDERIMTQAKGQSIGSTGDTELRRQEEAAARTAAKCERAHLRATQAPVSMGRSRASLKRKRKRQQLQTKADAVTVPAQQQQPLEVPNAPVGHSPPTASRAARGISCTLQVDPQDGKKHNSNVAAQTKATNLPQRSKPKKKKAKGSSGGGDFAGLEELNALSEKSFLSSLLKPVAGATRLDDKRGGSAKLLEIEARTQHKGREHNHHRERNHQDKSGSKKEKPAAVAVATAVDAKAQTTSRADTIETKSTPTAGHIRRTKGNPLHKTGVGGSSKHGTGTKGGGATSGTTVSTGVRHLGSGLFVRDLASGGYARRVVEGDTVQLTYVGRLSGSNKKFDRCSNPNKPFKFVVGAGEVVAGMDLGVRGMGKGGRRVITIPPRLGYGARSQPGIPGNSTLLFDVTVVRIGL